MPDRPRPVQKHSGSPKLAVIGLDCATPQLLFHQFRDKLPVLNTLRQGSSWGELTSIVPPITVPAWTCLFSGKDPGEIGCYGFRNRPDYTYDDLKITTSRGISTPRLWDHFAAQGYNSIVCGIPQTYPPDPVQGVLVSGLLTPGLESTFSYPPSFRDEILHRFPGYQFDVADFRTMGLDRFLDEVYSMAEQQFAAVRYLAETEEWNLLAMVEIGLDRIQHVFWKYMDKSHPLHEANPTYQSAILDYYRFLDGQIGTLLEVLPPDTDIMVVSDHGAQAMQGGFCINEWLIQHEYLVLNEPYPNNPVRIAHDDIDWSRTTAWSTGGYYGRIFLNVVDREPEGIVPARTYESVRDKIAGELSRIEIQPGLTLQNQVYTPAALYRETKGYPPDLLLLCDDMAWRFIGSVGYDTLYTRSDDEGPDGANHARKGVFLFRDHAQDGAGELSGAHLLDIVPSLLEKYGFDYNTSAFSGRQLLL